MILLCILLVVACLFDYRSARIPNWLVGVILVCGAGYRCRSGGFYGLGGFVISFLMVLFLLYPLFKIGTVGAGDVKLYAAVSGFLSGRVLICFLIYSVLIAGVISIFRIFREGNGIQRVTYFFSYLADVIRGGHWKLYVSEAYEEKMHGVCMAGPVLLSMLLHWGGVY